MTAWYSILTLAAVVLMLWATFFHEDEDAKEKMQNHTPLWKRIWRRIK